MSRSNKSIVRLSRREVLLCMGGGAYVLGATGPISPLMANAARKKLRIGACDWSIGQRQNPAAFALGKAIGLDGIQVSFDGGENDLRDEEVRKRYVDAVAETGVAISSLAMGVLNRVPYASDPNAEKWVHECVDVMATMRSEAAAMSDRLLAQKVSPRIVLLAFFGKGDINKQPALVAETIARLKQVAPRAAEAGVVLGLETWLNADDLLHIIESVDSPAVQVYYDTANANKMGYDVYKEVGQIGKKNLCQIHFKENGFLLGKGRIDFNKFKVALDDIVYGGWCIIESAVNKELGVQESYIQNRKYLDAVLNG